MTLDVAPVGPGAAAYAVRHWHYSRTMPVGTAQRYGVWEAGSFVGVVLFGRGAAPNLGAAFGFGRYDVCELTRVALREHAAPVSQIVPRAVAALRRSSPATRVVFSFADPWHGHHGGIYQAMNWLYLGTTADARRYRDRVTGELHHQRVVTASGVVRQFGRATRAIRPDSCDLVIVPGKHRYALPLDRAARRVLSRAVVEYPHAAEASTVTR